MKTIRLMLIAIALLPVGTEAAATNRSPREIDPLVARFDLNENGKIDVEERRDYVREVARQRRAEVKELARQRPKLNYQERLFYRLPRLTPELIAKYDTDGNGKIDLAEQAQIMHDAAKEARTQFRRFDLNGDGFLDQDELKAMEEVQARERRQKALEARETQAAAALDATPTQPAAPPQTSTSD